LTTEPQDLGFFQKVCLHLVSTYFKGEGFRIECRIGGADTNVYLAFAAVLAAGIDGLENKLPCPPAVCCTSGFF
jgi:glutamine synthetase